MALVAEGRDRKRKMGRVEERQVLNREGRGRDGGNDKRKGRC